MEDLFTNPLFLLISFVLLFLIITYNIKNNINNKILRRLNIIKEENEYFSNILRKNI